MASDFTANSCGGIRWRTLRGGLIELEDQGIPEVAPGSPKFLNLTRTWQHFGSLLGAAADREGLPRSWLLAFATVETGFLSADPGKQATAVSPVGALGVMQLMPQYFTQYSPAQLLNPSINITASAQFINRLCKSPACPWRCELPYLGSVYNAGSGSRCVQCQPGRNIFSFIEEGDYSLGLVQYNNAAIRYLDLSSGSSGWMLGGAVVAGAAAWLLL